MRSCKRVIWRMSLFLRKSVTWGSFWHSNHLPGRSPECTASLADSDFMAARQIGTNKQRYTFIASHKKRSITQSDMEKRGTSSFFSMRPTTRQTYVLWMIAFAFPSLTQQG